MITSEAEWLKAYKENRNEVWVKVSMASYRKVFVGGPRIVESVVYFPVSEYDVWKDIVSAGGKMVIEIELRFRSNTLTINTSAWEGVYLIRSVMGTMGGDSQHFIVLGQCVGHMVRKQMILIPELTTRTTYEDPMSECFSEATYLNG
jgi:hypothetical protein